MGRQAQRVDESRSDIVQLAEVLHRTIGLAATTIVEAAQRPGVTRGRVDCHCKDEIALIDACSSSRLQQHQPPDPSNWEWVAGPAELLRNGLGEWCSCCRSGAQMLEQLYGDFDWPPAHRQVALLQRADLARAALLSISPWAPRGSPFLGAMAGNAGRFQPWRVLCSEFCPAESAAPKLMAGATLPAARLWGPRRTPGGGRPGGRGRAPGPAGPAPPI